MNTIEEYLAAIEAREKQCVDLTASAGDIPNLLKLVRKYREALEQMQRNYGLPGFAEAALAYDPREEGKP